MSERNGPGTVPWRFRRLMDELEARFPTPMGHLVDSSKIPERYYLEQIDRLLTNTGGSEGNSPLNTCK